MTGLDVIAQFLYYFPSYVALVLVPAIIRALVEKYILGIDHRVFSSAVVEALRSSVTYEDAFRAFAVTALFAPLFEEVVFRGIPMMLLGLPGIFVGSAVWVLMHPAWQLQYLRGEPLWKRVGFTLTSAFYYALNAAFYAMLWINGAGLVAILYHMFHNGWLTLVDVTSEAVRDIRIQLPKLPIRRGGEEEAEEIGTPMFISRRIPTEAADIEAFVFVRRKGASEGAVKVINSPVQFVKRKQAMGEVNG